MKKWYTNYFLMIWLFLVSIVLSFIFSRIFEIHFWKILITLISIISIYVLFDIKWKFVIPIIIFIIFLNIFLYYSYFWLPLYLLVSVFVSIFVIYFISYRRTIFKWFISITLVFINLILFVFAIIPTYSADVDMDDFYKKRENYFTIDKVWDWESYKELKEKNVKIIVVNDNKQRLFLNLSKPLPKSKYEVLEWDLLFFESKYKKLDIYLTIHFWDGTIVRVLPQTKISINKILVNIDELAKSETKIQVDDGNIWFNIIKTIINDKWFNVETKQGSLVIRWTSGLVSVNSKKDKTRAYSNDHIIQIQNSSWEKDIITNWEVVEFTPDSLKKLDFKDFVDEFSLDFFKLRDEINSMDDINIDQYKDEIAKYINENFSWNLENNKRILWLSEYKMKLINKVNQSNNLSQIENYARYKLLKYWHTDDYNIDNYSENDVFIPLNNGVDKMKLEIFKFFSTKNIEYMQSYIISLYNDLLDMWKNINIDELKHLLENANINNIQNNINSIYKQIMN